ICLGFFRTIVQVTNALTSRRYDTEMIRDLSRVRLNFDDMCRFYAGILKEYESPELRKGREEILKSTAQGMEYCANIVATIDRILSQLETFKT
ncbi:MAG TPA: hypothetical protein VNF68_05320, partial [Candidatus Baltobacteraceae bacterium]|nr:hypothetical protein [Candidatus Baltobacteraceae bacterium]